MGGGLLLPSIRYPYQYTGAVLWAGGTGTPLYRLYRLWVLRGKTFPKVSWPSLTLYLLPKLFLCFLLSVATGLWAV